MTVSHDPADGCYYHKPTFGERLARAFGFRFHLGEEPDGAEAMPGWAKSTIRVRLSVGDRMRLLITGKLDLGVTHYCDRPVNTMVNRVDINLPAPWEQG